MTAFNGSTDIVEFWIVENSDYGLVWQISFTLWFGLTSRQFFDRPGSQFRIVEKLTVAHEASPLVFGIRSDCVNRSMFEVSIA